VDKDKIEKWKRVYSSKEVDEFINGLSEVLNKRLHEEYNEHEFISSQIIKTVYSVEEISVLKEIFGDVFKNEQ
jgi:thiaminase